MIKGKVCVNFRKLTLNTMQKEEVLTVVDAISAYYE